MAITAISGDWGQNPRIVRITTTDDLATITTAGYVAAQEANIEAIQNGAFTFVPGDFIAIYYSDGQGFFTYDADTLAFVAGAVVPGSLSDTLLDGHIFVGNGANVATGVAMSGDVHIINTGAATVQPNVIDTGKLALNTIQYAQVAMTAAQFNGMYAAPFVILAAPGANKIIQVDNVWYDMAFVAAQYAAGGVVNLQFDSTVHGAGVPITQDTAAATITGLAASSIVVPGLKVSAFAQATTVNKGVYMSNATQAFTTGDGTWKINLAYRVLTA